MFIIQNNSCSNGRTLFHLLFLLIIVFGFVKADNNEESCFISFWPIYSILGILNLLIIGGIIYLSIKMFYTKSNNNKENEENKKEDKKKDDQKELKE